MEVVVLKYKFPLLRRIPEKQTDKFKDRKKEKQGKWTYFFVSVNGNNYDLCRALCSLHLTSLEPSPAPGGVRTMGGGLHSLCGLCLWSSLWLWSCSLSEFRVCGLQTFSNQCTGYVLIRGRGYHCYGCPPSVRPSVFLQIFQKFMETCMETIPRQE